MTDLTLTHPEPPPPVKRCCGTCRWFQWATGPTGRKRKAEQGECKWPLPWPEKWPASFQCYSGMSRDINPRRPFRASMWHDMGSACECWEAKP